MQTTDHPIFIRPDKKPAQKQNLDTLVQRADRVIFRAKTVFPFDFFPDEIIVDEVKVNLVRKDFFLSERIRSILLKDIPSVIVETAPLFATIKIADNSLPSEHIVIRYLKKIDAIRLRRIIQGLIVCDVQNIDISALNISEVLKKTEEIGNESELGS